MTVCTIAQLAHECGKQDTKAWRFSLVRKSELASTREWSKGNSHQTAYWERLFPNSSLYPPSTKYKMKNAKGMKNMQSISVWPLLLSKTVSAQPLWLIFFKNSLKTSIQISHMLSSTCLVYFLPTYNQYFQTEDPNSMSCSLKYP